MKIDCSDLRFAEQVVLHFDRPRIGSSLRIASAEQATVFSLEADDPIHPPIR